MPEQQASKDAGLQHFLDDISQCELAPRQLEWFHLDVATMFSESLIQSHELEHSTGKSLLFLEQSLVLLCPEQHILHHFPKSLIHCFVEDRRHHVLMADEAVFRIELFSISPLEEQLCWVASSSDPHDVPALQTTAAKWMAWLNRR
jgi:hypothetical protein